MNISFQLAKHLRDVHYGGNFTGVNLKDTLAGVSWQQATEKVGSFNTIVALVYHINYYVSVVLEVLEGKPLNASDKFSYNHPPINSEEDWKELKDNTWNDVTQFASLVEQMPDSKLLENFEDGKYGNYFRNLQGIIEHTHYHLGQIVLLKKMIQQ